MPRRQRRGERGGGAVRHCRGCSRYARAFDLAVTLALVHEQGWGSRGRARRGAAAWACASRRSRAQLPSRALARRFAQAATFGFELVLQRHALLLQAIMLDLTQLFLGDAVGFDALFFGQARGAFFFARALLVDLEPSLGRQSLGALLHAQLDFAELLVGPLGHCQSAPHLDIDVGSSDFEQTIGKGVDERSKIRSTSDIQGLTHAFRALASVRVHRTDTFIWFLTLANARVTYELSFL